MVNRVKGFSKVQVYDVCLPIIVNLFTNLGQNLQHLSDTWYISETMLSQGQNVHHVIIKPAKTERSRTSTMIGKRDIGRKFSGRSWGSFLWTWVTFAFFHWVSSWPGAIWCLHSSRRRAGIPSGTHDFAMSRLRRWHSTSSTVTWKSSSFEIFSSKTPSKILLSVPGFLILKKNTNEGVPLFSQRNSTW